MTVPIETSLKQYNGDGSTTTYTYPFKVFEDDDLVVVVTNSSDINATLTLNVDYTVTGAGDVGGGTIVLTSGGLCDAGEKLTIIRDVQRTQDTDYIDGENFSQESVENALDRFSMVIQQQKEKHDRSLHFPIGDETSSELPGITARANKNLGFDTNGAITATQANAISYTGEIYETYTDLKAVDTSGLSDKAPAIVQFRSTKGDGGGGVFYWDSTDHSATGTGLVASDTEGGVYVAPTTDTTGASGAWVRAYSGTVNGRWFGASPLLGATANTTAIQAALSFSSSVYIPSGTYLLNDQLTVANKTTSIVGDGIANSILRWESTATDTGIDITENDDGYFVYISRLSLVTEKAGLGTAITVTRSGEESAGVVQDRTTPRVLLSDLLITGATAIETDGWLNGISFVDCIGTNILRVAFVGYLPTAATPTSEAAIALSGSYSGTEHNIFSVRAFGCTYGVRVTGTVEGVIVRSSYFINLTYGVHWVSSSGDPGLSFSSNHVNFET